jgi:hypothetical protein
MSAQVSSAAWVCFNEVYPLREQREYEVLEAAHREREARAELEAATRREDPAVPVKRASWQDSARVLVEALRRLKT